ncbi:iron-containing alcohol dehydrogenase family protein [Eisenbergiella sp.]|uniref:iron-containing alcohol dehydrogenase family protein n=1 Tax=Eisenbergiella sp. TaxID=1924109 RepID=UPI00208199FF|nr:iron-containing alcohol dehydrogenase family protein [Eisenbergiella sp.]BDF47422.1 alcohol dehydrogenase [Lachnospiraceae bacterium]GKH43497.1 alcohol dehydrogenase [Lachnospiraceae bacterium]
MKLFMPTKVYSEKNCVENHSRELAALGTKALVVTGKHSSRINGSLEDVTKALERENIPYMVYDEIEENPSVETVMKAASLGITEGTDFVIGVGGGSPMDASKAIALMIANPEHDERLLYTRTQVSPDGPVYPALPVAEIPTTAGTGSEVTPYAILTKNVLPDIVLTTIPEADVQAAFSHLEKKTKQSISHSVFPALALVDVSYLQTASRSGCINTAVDTLAHLIESHLNANSTEYSRIYSEMGLRTWARIKDKLLRYEIGEEERQALMRACTLGGMAIAHTGTSLPHGLSYPVTCEMGLPHGKAVGIFLPGFIRNYGNQEEAMKVLSLLDFGGEQTFSEYIRQLLGEVSIAEDLWERTMDELLANPAKLKNYPFMIDKEKLQRFR